MNFKPRSPSHNISMESLITNWKPTEQEARNALENLHNDLVPMKMLFPDAKYFSQNTWDSRFDAVFKTQHQWNLLSSYADGHRWSTMKDEDIELFDFWLIDWYDYDEWIRGAKRPDQIAHEMRKRGGSRRTYKPQPSQPTDALDRVFKDFISSSESSVSLPGLNPWDRKWIHIRSEQANIQSVSVESVETIKTMTPTKPVETIKTMTLTKPDGWKLPNTPEKTRREVEADRRAADEDKEDALFQIYCKYRAWGYDSPDEMIDREPGLAMVAGI